MKPFCCSSFLFGRTFKSIRKQYLSKEFSTTPSHITQIDKNKIPRGYWKSLSNQRKFFNELAKQFGLKELDDWYSVLNRKVILENGGGFLDLYYQNSPLKAITAVYSEHEWLPWKFEKIPKSWWDSIENRRLFFDWLGKKLGVKQLDDWYYILDTQVVLDNGGTFVRRKPVVEVLLSTYPEHPWDPWNFQNPGPWRWQQNSRSFFDWLGKQLGVKQLDDWYSLLSKKVICDYHGRYILDRTPKGSDIEALTQAYPEHNWLPWKFKTVGKRFWISKENQRFYFDWLGSHLGVKQLDDWYQVLSLESLKDNCGHGLLNHHNDSAISALMACYPEHHWQPWRFEKCRFSQKFYQTKQELSDYLADLAEKLCIQRLDDWYRVDMIQLHKMRSVSIIKNRGGLYRILKDVYPDHPWDLKRFQTTKKAQRWLFITLKKIFPNEEIIEDYTHPKVVFSSKRPMQLDVFIPSRSLAFEYQGEHHFQDVQLFGDSAQYRKRDVEKRSLCAANNIKLIEVPYWWDRTQENLLTIIHKASTSSIPAISSLEGAAQSLSLGTKETISKNT